MKKGVLLGITDKNPVYMVNKNGTVVSFVQAGELWNYNRDRDEVSLCVQLCRCGEYGYPEYADAA